MDSTVSFRVTGKVQGVGFRYFTKTTADQYQVNGWVKNHPDGSVVGHVQGDHGLVKGFLETLQVGNRWSDVDSLETQVQPFTGEFHGFDIRY